jgi:PAS domain S-box-containing protein
MISFKVILGSLLILLVVAIAVLGAVCYDGNLKTLDAVRWVDHSHRVVEKVDAISITCKNIQLQAGKIEKSRKRLEATKILFAATDSLRALTSDNSDQNRRIDSLEANLRQWIASDYSAVIGTDSGWSVYHEAVSRQLNSIKATEEILLRQRVIRTQKSAAGFKSTLALLLCSITVLLLSAFFAIRYNFNKRIRMQEELRRSNVLFEKVFYESPIAIVISELGTGKILHCNSVFAGTVNYSMDELVGNTAVQLGIFESLEQRNNLVSDAIAGGVAKQTEVYIQPRGGDRIYVSIHAHVIPLYDGPCLLTAILDLSSHKQAEEDTRKALEAVLELSRLKADFVTLASHEFRTPLTTIRSSAFLLENYSYGESRERAVRHLAKINSSVNSLTSMLDEFLAITKIDEGRVHPSFEQIDLPAFLADLCRNLQASAKPGQTIGYDHTGSNDVLTDRIMLSNIVRNLVTNAIKYSPENSPIYVSTRVNGKIYLTVIDAGIGISKEDQKHLFERFYRASNAGNAQGTGLGLHIIKRYVEMLEGTVTLESNTGKGTQVNVILSMPAGV